MKVDLQHRRPLPLPRIFQLLQDADTCILGLCDRGRPYLLPMNCTITREGNQMQVKLLPVSFGWKMRCLARNPFVCLTLIHQENSSCESVDLFGRARVMPGNPPVVLVTVTEVTGREFSYLPSPCSCCPDPEENCPCSPGCPSPSQEHTHPEFLI